MPQTDSDSDLTWSDNTNADSKTRAVWVKLAQKLKVPIRCVLFTASVKLCEHNDTFRALNVGSEVSFPTPSFRAER
jgi:predicted kinase